MRERSDQPRVIMTADDFGRSRENNAGVLAAHHAGVVNAASLMVGESGFAEAVQIAKENPKLKIGLHICLSDGTPTSWPSDVALLLNPNGEFPTDEKILHRAVLSSAGRNQVRQEITAQFRRFATTGLVCDHVDVHRNSHMHPLVAREVFRAAAAWNVKMIRIPRDPDGHVPGVKNALRLGRVMLLRRIAAYYDLEWIDRVIGRIWRDPQELAALISSQRGTAEYFFHPVVCEGDHMFKHDLPILLDNRVLQTLQRVGA